MKRFIIRETTGYPTVVRNGETVLLGLGDWFDESELSTLTVETYVTYICPDDNSISTIYNGASDKVVKAPVEVPVEVLAEETPAVVAKK